MADEKKRKLGLVGSLGLNGLVFIVAIFWILIGQVVLESVQVLGLILLCFVFGLTALCAPGPGSLTHFVAKFWVVLGLVWLLPGYVFWFLLVEPDLPGLAFLLRGFLLLDGFLVCVLEAIFLDWAGLRGTYSPTLYPRLK